MIWLAIVLVAASLYAVGLLSYRLCLSLRRLRSLTSETEAKLQAFSAPELEISPAVPSQGADLSEIVMQRRRLLAQKRERARQRERRLIARISSIQIDKR